MVGRRSSLAIAEARDGKKVFHKRMLARSETLIFLLGKFELLWILCVRKVQ